LRQERHGPELQRLRPDRPSREGESEPARARRAREDAALERAAVERRAAPRARVLVREQRAADVRDEQRRARDGGRSPRVGAGPETQEGPASGSSRLIRGGGAIAPSTSIPSRSGAASSSACSIASSSVEADAGQPSQLPFRRSHAKPFSSETSSTSPPCEARY